MSLCTELCDSITPPVDWLVRIHKQLSPSALRLPISLRLMIPRHSRLPYRHTWHLHRRRLLSAGELFGGRFSDSLFCNYPAYGTMITQCAVVRKTPAGTFEKVVADERKVYHRSDHL